MCFIQIYFNQYLFLILDRRYENVIIIIIIDQKGLVFSSFFGATNLYDEVTVRGCPL